MYTRVAAHSCKHFVGALLGAHTLQLTSFTACLLALNHLAALERLARGHRLNQAVITLTVMCNSVIFAGARNWIIVACFPLLCKNAEPSLQSI